MTKPTLAQVVADIETVRTSFSYDPPQRWNDAYNRLCALRTQLKEAQKAHRWLVLVGTGVFVACVFMMLNLLLTHRVSEPIWTWNLLVMVSVPSALTALCKFLAERREPLLKRLPDIEGACRKFDEAAPLPREPQNAAS
jgi:hypothetical protein